MTSNNEQKIVSSVSHRDDSEEAVASNSSSEDNLKSKKLTRNVSLLNAPTITNTGSSKSPSFISTNSLRSNHRENIVVNRNGSHPIAAIKATASIRGSCISIQQPSNHNISMNSKTDEKIHVQDENANSENPNQNYNQKTATEPENGRSSKNASVTKDPNATASAIPKKSKSPKITKMNKTKSTEPTKLSKLIQSLNNCKTNLFIYYWKATILIIIGLFTLAIGSYLTYFHFKLEATVWLNPPFPIEKIDGRWENVQLPDYSDKPYFITGPIFTATGIMAITVGIVWIGIIREDRKVLITPSASKQNTSLV